MVVPFSSPPIPPIALIAISSLESAKHGFGAWGATSVVAIAGSSKLVIMTRILMTAWAYHLNLL